MLQPFGYGQFTPGFILFLLLAAVSAILLGYFKQSVGTILASVENNVFNPVPKFSGNVFVNGQLSRIDDTHGETRFNSMVEKHRVYGFPNRVVAAE